LSKYLLEIGTEELPAKFSHSVLEQFKSLIEFELDKKLIKFENIVVTSTPRRIVLILEGLVDYSEDKIIERKGPKANSAYLNGEDYDLSWIEHKDILDGGELRLIMGSKPSSWGTTLLPPSMSNNLISPNL